MKIYKGIERTSVCAIDEGEGRTKEAEKQSGEEVEKVEGKPEKESKPRISAKDINPVRSNPDSYRDVAPQVATSNGVNILVVDDEQVILDLFKRVLGTKGYNVICAQDGLEAVEMAKDKRIDLAFIDIKLPGGMNGVGTFRMIKKAHPGIKAVMITGFSVEKEIAEAIKDGAVGALMKPFDNIQEIYNMIDKNLKKR